MYFYFLQKDATIDHQIKDKALNCQGCGFWDIPFYFECILPDLCSFASWGAFSPIFMIGQLR